MKKSVFMKGKMVLLLVACTTLLLPSFDTSAATQKQQALKAYKQFLSKSTVTIIPLGRRYEDQWSLRMVNYTGTPSSKVRFAIAYIDNDSIPELIIERIEDHMTCALFGIFTYKNGKVLWVKAGRGYDYYIGCYAKTGTFLTRDTTDGALYHDQYTVFKNGKATPKLTKTVAPYEFKEYYRNQNGGLKKISFQAFSRLLKNLNGGRKLTRVNYHNNTAGNRNTYLK